MPSTPRSAGAPPQGRLRPRRRRAGASRRRGWTHRIAVRARTAHTRVEDRFPVLPRLAERMVSVNILDSATRLAAQSFLTAVPLLFVVAAYAPPLVRHQMVTSLRTVFGLTGAVNSELEHVLQPTTGDLRQATGVVSGLMVLLSATAMSRAVQRLCKRAWKIPRAGTRIAPWRWLAWIVLWLAALVVQGPLHQGFGAGPWLGIPMTLAGLTGLWWWTQHLLLGGLIGWRPLLPGAVITAAALTALTVTARLYMPRALERTLAEYGPLGSVFVMLSWLIVVCVAVALSISAGAVLAEEPARARRLRAGCN
ncbi:YhjD/YihY/BrkB family envelope integrity protein [Streptomyces cinerochromogenes]|uniref:YhjD/YihY/BrkB family envelope integrity protein n=1 Tax=Streptomyces cinerochromogenes TaxID=66422 RepID=UPI00166F790B|nr:YhjD/YihY/BrkB family envelope integrity protein [Streptomyces cinerochromogenes]GGS90214.1 hypothetical protein GCM10010206_61240 [Streptomyces cinerochromogenes]